MKSFLHVLMEYIFELIKSLWDQNIESEKSADGGNTTLQWARQILAEYGMGVCVSPPLMDDIDLDELNRGMWMIVICSKLRLRDSVIPLQHLFSMRVYNFLTNNPDIRLCLTDFDKYGTINLVKDDMPEAFPVCIFTKDGEIIDEIYDFAYLLAYARRIFMCETKPIVSSEKVTADIRHIQKETFMAALAKDRKKKERRQQIENYINESRKYIQDDEQLKNITSIILADDTDNDKLERVALFITGSVRKIVKYDPVTTKFGLLYGIGYRLIGENDKKQLQLYIKNKAMTLLPDVADLEKTELQFKDVGITDDSMIFTKIVNL